MDHQLSSNLNTVFNTDMTMLEKARSMPCVCTSLDLDRNKECVCERSDKIRQAKNKLNNDIKLTMFKEH